MRSEIADALRVLQGLPMWAAGRTAVSLLWLHFGGVHDVVDRSGAAKTVGDYALHIDCPWRIVQRDVVVVGALDRFSPGDGQEDDDFDWNHSWDTRWDRRLRPFMERYGTVGLIVRGIDVRGQARSRCGSTTRFRLRFSRTARSMANSGDCLNRIGRRPILS